MGKDKNLNIKIAANTESAAKGIEQITKKLKNFGKKLFFIFFIKTKRIINVFTIIFFYIYSWLVFKIRVGFFYKDNCQY